MMKRVLVLTACFLLLASPRVSTKSVLYLDELELRY